MRSPKRLHAIAALSIFVSAMPPLFAQAASIGLFFEEFGERDYEGALVLPHRRGEVGEVARALVPFSSKDGMVKAARRLFPGAVEGWTISSLGSGRCDFYVTSPFAEAPFPWGPEVKVRFESGGRVREIASPVARGMVWHVLTLYPDGIEEVNAVLPALRLVRGYVQDAVTGKAVAGAAVSLIHRVGPKEVASARTDELGRYAFVAPEGVDFALRIAAGGYIPWEDRIFFATEDYPRRADAYLSPIMKTAQYRFVLSWGQYPSDLDSHLTGPEEGGVSTFHISYRNMRTYTNRHSLDRDSVSGYGPETITLTRLDDGMYYYAVHDFSNRSSAGSQRLSASGATVRVYREAELIATASVPEMKAGTLWRAFSLDGRTGELRALDDLVYESDPSRFAR